MEGEIAEARLHVSGLGYNEIYINGERVGERVLEPGISNYERTILYSTYNVTDLLSAGENAIGAALGRGWFGLPTENVWFWEQAPWWSDPQLFAWGDTDRFHHEEHEGTRRMEFDELSNRVIGCAV